MASETTTGTKTEEKDTTDTTAPEQAGGAATEDTATENTAAENTGAEDTGADGAVKADTDGATAGTRTPERAGTPEATASPTDGAVVAAGAVVSAGLGLASLTGTSLGDMFRAREELLGQIAAVTGGGGDQIEALYGGPWHTVALVNGTFALIAAIIGAVLVFGPARKPGTPAWGRALALGGLTLGVIGLVVSGGMYIDLFAAPPQMPTLPGMPGMPG